MWKKPRQFFCKRVLPLSPVVSMLFALSCGEGPTKVDVKKANEPPETYITAKSLSKVPLETDSTGAVINLNQFAFLVEFTATDIDGTVDSFAVRIDGGAWTAWTAKRSFNGFLDFASEADQHKVEVKSKDNENTEDPSPAAAMLTLAELKANQAPNTAFVSGPSNGATTGRGVRFEIKGDDEDGEVVRFIVSIDGGTESTLDADTEGKAVLEFSSALGNLLSTGNHAISVTSVDNLGMQDPTPATRSFFVATGFKPILTQTGGPPPGGGWFTGANIPFAWNVSTAHYFGVIDHFEFSIDDPANFQSTTLPGVSLEPQAAGPHTFRLKAIDTEGNASDVLEVGFEVAAFAPTEGILFIDNVSFTPGGGPYGSEPETDQMILDGFFKNFSRVSVWDCDRLSGDGRFPTAINDKPLPGPADLAKYSSVVIMTDFGAPASSDIRSISALLAAYFQAGGNLMVTGYNTTTFGQVLKDVLGTPSVFNGFGTDFQSLEGFQEASSRNSADYAFISGADIVPIIPGVASRSWEITSNITGVSWRILFANVGPDGAFGGFRIATEIQGEKGNYGIWLGMSMFYLDQTSSGIVKLGDFILGNRFGEM